LEDAIGGQGIMKKEIKKVESALFIVTGTFNIAKLFGEDIQMVGQEGDILELTQGELEHVGQDRDVVEVEYMRVEVILKHAQGLLMKAKEITIAENVYFGLLSKKNALEPKILMSQKVLENAIKQKTTLQAYVAYDTQAKLIFSTPKPIPHYLTHTFEPITFTIISCLVCNHYFHNFDAMLTSCGCLYHGWYIGFRL